MVMDKIAKMAREILGIGENIGFRSLTILTAPERPIRIVAEMEVREATAPRFDVLEEAATISKDVFQGLAPVKEPKKAKRKYTYKDKAPAKPVSKLDANRVYTTSDDDIRMMRTYINNWRRYDNALTEDQIRALKTTEGLQARSMSTIEKTQLLGIFNDIRKTKGLIK